MMIVSLCEVALELMSAIFWYWVLYCLAQQGDIEVHGICFVTVMDIDIRDIEPAGK